MIQWNDSLSVGVKQIDTQHQKLITLIHDLNDAMKVGKGKDVVGKIIKELVDYTVVHFRQEEGYFAKFDYAETEQHIAEHKAFIAEVSKFQEDFNNGRLGLSLNVMNFLSNWLTKHIMGTDKKYSTCFTANGLS
ncbi:MAG: bacteriohemerythrin [FCB group bacterium]|nr:bacteriohemerythrin [FCB group bacterium]